MGLSGQRTISSGSGRITDPGDRTGDGDNGRKQTVHSKCNRGLLLFRISGLTFEMGYVRGEIPEKFHAERKYWSFRGCRADSTCRHYVMLVTPSLIDPV